MLASVFLSSSNFGVRLVGPAPSFVIDAGTLAWIVLGACTVGVMVEGAGCGFVSSSLSATGGLATVLVNRLPDSAAVPSVDWVPLFLFVMDISSRTSALWMLSFTTRVSGVTASLLSCDDLAEGGGSVERTGSLRFLNLHG